MAKHKQEIIVHCEFTDKGEEVKDILHEVFHAYAERKTHEKYNFR